MTPEERTERRKAMGEAAHRKVMERKKHPNIENGQVEENYGYRAVHSFIHGNLDGEYAEYTVWFQEGNASFMVTKTGYDAIGQQTHTSIGEEAYGSHTGINMTPEVACIEALIEILVTRNGSKR